MVVRVLFVCVFSFAAELSAAQTCKSSVPGDWSVPGNWDCRHAPAIGDTAILDHAMRVDVSTAVGTSPASGNVVITINRTGSLRIASGAVLSIRGDVKKDGPVYLECGSTWEWDGSVSHAKYQAAASAHSLKDARMLVVLPGETIAGDCTPNPVTVRSVLVGSGSGTANGWFQSGWLESGQWDAKGITFLRIGDSINPAIRHWLSGANDVFRLQNFTFVDSGPIKRGGNSPSNGSATFVITDGVFTNSQQSYSLDFTATVARTTGKWQIQRNYFDKALGDPSTSPNYQGVTLSHNIMASNFSSSGGAWDLWEYNVVRDIRGGLSNNDNNIYGSVYNSFWLEDPTQVNPHWPTLKNTTIPLTVQGNILQAGPSASEGDGFFPQTSGGLTSSFLYNLVLPNSGGGNSSGGITNVSANVDSHVIIEHNTMPLGSGATANHGVSYNESNIRGTPAGVVTSYRSNIIWWFSPKTTNHFWKAGAKFVPSDNIADPLLTANNTCWHCGVANQTGKTSDGTYYDLPTTGFAPGVNDINLDPGFVDPTRNFETAGQILWGVDGTIDGTLLALKADPAARIPELMEWIKAGFAPTNLALATAAHDGTYIGAVSVVSAAAATQCSGVGTNAMTTLAARHDTAAIALEQARALVNAATVEADPRQREVIADRIGELRARHDTADIALEEARALVNAATVEAGFRQIKALSARIGELRARHDTADIALEEARALVNATVSEPDPTQRKALAYDIRELLARHDLQRAVNVK